MFGVAVFSAAGVDVVDVIAVFFVVEEQQDAPDVLLFFVTVVVAVTVSLDAHSSLLEAFLAAGVTAADEVVEAVDVVEQHEAEAVLLPFFESPQAAFAVTAKKERDIAATTKTRIVVVMTTP